MDKRILEENIKQIISYYNEVNKYLSEIYSWVKQKNESREILEDFLNYIWIINTPETRLASYFRLIDLKENSLVLYLENNNFSKEETEEKLNLAYEYVSDFHLEIQNELIKFIENNNLLTDFYLEIFKWVYKVWKQFNNFFLPWRNHIINWINKKLEADFENDSDKIMDFLNKNNLFDLWHNWDLADRSYSALIIQENWDYKSESYKKVFDFEVSNIEKSLQKFIDKLDELEDEIFNSKEEYIVYLKAIKEAFSETNMNNLLEKWSNVDEAWMEIKTPFQIWHPLEFYEDKYRKAVAPEWDLRINNKVFETNIENDIEKMHETFYDEIWREKYKSSYEFSKANIKRVQLYLSSPILYFSSELTGLFSAQVVPNDEVISDKKWKKIFAYPEMVMDSKRSLPFMLLSNIIFEEGLLDKYRKILFSDSKNFYKIYDIETIGHEFWHTLWLDIDTESKMNYKTWVYKKIEEFKATVWWLITYFMSEKQDLELAEKLLIFHIIRCFWLLAYKKVNEVEPYYCEVLIHLEILFESKIIKINTENKIELLFNDKNYTKLKDIYVKHYKKLINIYLEKKDADIFLRDYVIKDWLYYLPKDEKVRDFVNYYYKRYEEIGNEIDEKISKEKYLNN